MNQLSENTLQNQLINYCFPVGIKTIKSRFKHLFSKKRNKDIEQEENIKRTIQSKDYIIRKNVFDTPSGLIYKNGELYWINGKPTYVVNMDYYFYEGYQIKIYYELYNDFDIKMGFYDNNSEFVEFKLDLDQ